MLNVPLVPATLVCATKVFGLSTSEIVSVPLVERTASVSVNTIAALLNCAASLVPFMVT